MSNPITKLIKTVHNFGKSSQPCKLVIPTYTTQQTCVLDSEAITYCQIKVNGKVYEGQEALDFLNKK